MSCTPIRQPANAAGCRHRCSAVPQGANLPAPTAPAKEASMRRRSLLLAAALYAGGAASAALLLEGAPAAGPALAAQAAADPTVKALAARIASLEASVERLTSAISINAAGNVTISTPKLKVNAPLVEMSGPLATFGGTVKGKTVQVDSVIAKSYTPGAGNVW
jgi:hypothetical protein